MERVLRPEAGAEIARFFQRIFAAVIDGILLALIFFFAVVPLFGWFAPEALITQGAANLTYFALFNSSIGGGATPGKRVMGICVVDRSGEYISLPRALLRSAVDLVPSMLGVYIPMAIPWTTWPVAEIGAAVSTAFGLTNIYLYVFNWQTRQVLHDLAARTFVVKSDTSESSFDGRTPAAHIAFAGLLIAVVGFVGTRVSLFHEAVDGPALCDRAVTDAVRTLPFVDRAFVNRKPMSLVRYSDPDHTTIMAYVQKGVDYQQARLIARKAVGACPLMHDDRRITVLLLPRPKAYSLKPQIAFFAATAKEWREDVVPQRTPGKSMRLEDGCTANIVRNVKKLPFAERVEVSNWIAQRPQGPTRLKQVRILTSATDTSQKSQAEAVARRTLEACPAMTNGDQMEIIIYPTGAARPARIAQVFGHSVHDWRASQ